MIEISIHDYIILFKKLGSWAKGNHPLAEPSFVLNAQPGAGIRGNIRERN